MKHLFYIVSLILASLLFGCTTEGDVFDDDFSIDSNPIETSLIVSFLNEKYSTNNTNITNCATFIYPIDIAYNTNQIITVVNEDGLKEIIKSQSSNFHINSLVYPISVLVDDIETIIENNNDFSTLFQVCDIKTLNTTLINNINNCFDFQYTIILLDDLQNEVDITTSNDFTEFIENQGINYTATFQFPFSMNETIINNYFDIYQITNTCVNINCPEISIKETTIDNSYTFEASGYSGDNKYVWSINNEVINNGLFDGNNNEFFTFDFTENGTYTVCVFIETPECVEGTTLCQDIIIDTFVEIDDECPVISFMVTGIDNSYTFEASSSIELDSRYVWFVNDEFIENDTTIENSNQFTYDFPENGTYEVCAFVETLNCPQGVTYCETIEVTTNVNNCPEISFETSPPQNNIYNFTVLSSISLDASFVWSVNGVPTLENSNSFTEEFLFEGTYEICVFVETIDCPQGVTYCETIEVNNVDNGTNPFDIFATNPLQDKTLEVCADLTYDYQRSDGNSVFLIASHNQGLIIDGNFSWSINDQFIGSGEVIEYEFLDRGNYTICVFLVTPECPDGVSSCREFIVE